MGFLYTKRFDIISHKTGETIIQIINRKTAPVTRDPFRIYSSNPYDNFLYYGKSYWNGFCISPVSESLFQYYFPVDITGRFERKQDKTILHLTIGLNRVMKFFLAAIIFVSILVFLHSTVILKQDVLSSVVILVIGVVFPVIAQIIFRLQLKKHRELLTRLLEN